MKVLKNILLGVLCTFGLSSCNDLLDIEPVNSMIPKSIADYESVLLGGYPDSEYWMNTELMTDNVYVNPKARGSLDKISIPWYTWAETHQSDDQEYDAYWNQLYRSIFYANTILDDLKDTDVAEEDLGKYENVIGEAYALRAWSYFYLANLYAEPYAEENLNKPCVPLTVTTSDLHERTLNNTRETVEVIWNQIVSDLEEATKLLAGKPHISQFRFDQMSVEALKSRVFLFMGNNEAAIASASKVVNTFAPWDMNKIQELVDAEDNGPKYLFSGDLGVIDTGYGNDIMFSMGGGSRGAGWNIFYYTTGPRKPSVELFDCYFEKNTAGDTIFDYRTYIFDSFSNPDDYWGEMEGPTVYKMYSSQGDPHCYIAIKLGEVYVTRAEAYARQGKNTEALNDIKALLSKRIKTEDFADYEVLLEAETDVLQRVLKERRKETALDAGLRWFDLRRLGKPSLKHTDAEGNEYVLEKDDLRYVLQIPVSEQKSSPDMVLNPR